MYREKANSMITICQNEPLMPNSNLHLNRFQLHIPSRCRRWQIGPWFHDSSHINHSFPHLNYCNLFFHIYPLTFRDSSTANDNRGKLQWPTTQPVIGMWGEADGLEGSMKKGTKPKLSMFSRHAVWNYLYWCLGKTLRWQDNVVLEPCWSSLKNRKRGKLLPCRHNWELIRFGDWYEISNLEEIHLVLQKVIISHKYQLHN